MARIYRFQNTKEVETNSYCEDIMNIWISYRGAEQDDFEITEELVDEVCFEWEPFINLRLSTEAFAHLTPFEWIEKILSFETEEETWAFQMENKLDGVFAIYPTATLEEAFKVSESAELGLHNRYLIIAEAHVLEEFAPPFGLLVEVEQILEIHEVPEIHRKEQTTK